MQVFTGAYIKRYTLPAPIIYIKLNCSKSFYRRVGIYIFLFAVAFYCLAFHPAFAILSTYCIFVYFVFVYLPNGIQYIYFLISYLIGIKRYRWFHSYHAQQLKYMILHHIAQGTALLIVATTVFYTYGFGSGYLHMVYIIIIPYMVPAMHWQSAMPECFELFLYQGNGQCGKSGLR